MNDHGTAAPAARVSAAPTPSRGRFTRAIGGIALLLATSGLAACDSMQGNISLGVVGATALGSQAPSHEIEQIYYVGAFDPLAQLEPQMYRIRVHGQASLISSTNFASGWIRADLIDSLGTTIGFDKASGRAVVKKSNNDDDLARIGDGRKLFQFGPEGTRKVPEDHRLAIVMGASPESFFSAVESVLGTVAETISGQADSRLTRDLFDALVKVEAESRNLSEVQKDIAFDIKSE